MLTQCERCGSKYTNSLFKWCGPCQLNSLKNYTIISDNEKINDFVQEMQFKMSHFIDIVFEWIPYNQFNSINNMGSFTSAIWKDGRLAYSYLEKKYERVQGTKVSLKYSHNIDKLLNEAKEYSISYHQYNIRNIYGISQNPDTKEYIMVLEADKHCEICDNKYTDIFSYWCKPCQINSLTNQTSGNEKIDSFIQKMQLKILSLNDVIFEWIPYNEFNFVTKYLAVWKNGPLHFNKDKKKYVRLQNKQVILKYFYNLQDKVDVFLNEVEVQYSKNNQVKYDNSLKTGKEYSYDNNIRIIYGITQHPNTKNYIMVLCQDGYCEKCDKKCADTVCYSCKCEVIVKLTPYNQLNDIKEIGKGGFATVYSAIWENGSKEEANKKVALKYLHDTQNITKEFLDSKVKVHSVKSSYILDVYGITQNPDTKEYIIILKYVEGESFNNWIITNYKEFSWEYKMKLLYNITYGLKVIHQNQMVHHNFHAGNILIQNRNLSYISDIGLYGKVDDTAAFAAGGFEAPPLDQTQIYGVMSYVAPEVLKGEDYTQASDIYSLGMIMYFIATGKQPFYNCAHDQNLALNICNGIRPETNDSEVPKCYTDLMKKCWDSNPVNRPKAIEIEELIVLFYYSYKYDKSHELDFKMVMRIDKDQEHYEIEKQFKVAEEYRKSVGTKSTTHPQAIYTSRLLNPFIKNLPK